MPHDTRLKSSKDVKVPIKNKELIYKLTIVDVVVENDAIRRTFLAVKFECSTVDRRKRRPKKEGNDDKTMIV